MKNEIAFYVLLKQHPFVVFPALDCAHNLAVLKFEDLLKQRFTKTIRIQKILIADPKRIQNRAFDVDQRQDQGILQPLVFGLHMVDGIAVLYVCVESSNHET